ncbi:MAG: asparagine synthase (glutamine-hydrolyzing) [Nitrososphaerales archaeon]
MCGIAGVMSKLGQDVVPHVTNMLSCMANRGPDGVGIAARNKVMRSFNFADLKLDRLSGDCVLGHTRLAIVGGACGLQPFRSCDGNILLEHNGEIYNYKKLRNELIRAHSFETETDSEVIVHLLEENYRGDLFKALRRTVKKLDGVYALAVRDDKGVVIARDRIGVRQLYYGENSEIVAFASEKKPLWMIGIKDVHRVLPGHAVAFIKGKIRTQRLLRRPIEVRRNRIYHMPKAITRYKTALYNSVRERVQDLDRIGIIFSGGVDSVLIAKIVKDLGIRDLRCYSAGLVGSHDIKYSEEVAEVLGLKLKTKELTVNDVESILPKIIEVIEDTNAGQVEVAIPVYAAVELAHKDGLKVVLSGQGADELFGGYPWYSEIVERDGYDVFHKCMVKDLLLLYKETLEREDKITMVHSVELRVPYLDPKVIRLAMHIDPRLKIHNNDNFGKHVHRELAQQLGIPESIAYRRKEAAQHGSGIHEVIDMIARKRGFTRESAVKAGYGSISEKRERIGSSQRYGYLFGDEEMWIAEEHVQMYLDYLALKHGFTELEGASGLV